MSTVSTILHIYGHDADAVERALTTIFAAEDRVNVLRLEGTFSAVLERVTDPDLDAAYRYLICRPHEASRWTPVLELGNRTDGLDVELSRVLDGAPVFTVFDYGETVSGYTLARGGARVDRYISDPTWFEVDSESGGDNTNIPAPDLEALRGHPERFADLLPPDTAPEDFVRVVLAPGWWEDYSASTGEDLPAEERADEDELVDERDRMRCIALALELWSPTEYPLTQDLDDLANLTVGPGIILAFN
ncbi:MAG TPA: hypothetical protein VJO13_11965 [Ktedonobacterales bacterium]|nr:hypothetical protein [Ktedonobacterales bacterium]